MDKYVLLIAVALIATDAAAATLNKCVGENGHVTFTQAACPGGLAGESITVRSSSAGMSLAPVVKEVSPGAVVDGEVAPAPASSAAREPSACVNLSSTEIRKRVIQETVFVGMRESDVIKSWGKPSRVNRSSHGSDQWVYDRGHSSQYVYIGPEGCVTAWN